MNIRTLHECFKRLTSIVCLKIRHGPLKGRKWIISTGRNFLLGRYEAQKTETIVKLVQPGDIIYDIGAHVGYYSLIMAQRAEIEGHVYAFEPRPLNLDFLKKHIHINNFPNISVLPFCVGDTQGNVKFNARVGTGRGYISKNGNLSAEMISIDHAVKEGLLRPPSIMKIDVEGSELLVLRGALRTIELYKPKIMLAVHSEKLEKQCRQKLEPLGYIFRDIGQEKGDTEFIVTIP